MKIFRAFYLSSEFFIVAAALVFFYTLSYFVPQLLIISNLFFVSVVVLLIADIVLLFGNKNGINSYRSTPGRLSNGDQNEINIFLENRYVFKINCEIIDEIPF